MEETERVLCRMLNEREQVRIHGFGTFYVTTIKSHVIKQIRTKTPRIILEQKSVKFRPSPTFKDAIYERVRKPKGLKLESTQSKPQENEIKIAPVKAEVKPEAKVTPKPTIEFKPASFHPRVEKETMKKKILERWLASARLNKKEDKTPGEIAREALIVGNLLNQIKKAGYSSVNFTYSSDKVVNIYAGRPRRQLSHLTREIIGGFLDYIDIKEFHIPQERRMILVLNKVRNERISLDVHSFPVEGGSSIRISIG